MVGSVFMETLRQSWRAVLYWALGMGAMALFVVAIVPDVNGLAEMRKLFESLPPFLTAALGVATPEDLQFITTPEGFLATVFFGKMALLFAIYPLVMGLRITINEEDEGIMDVVLSLPVPRWRVVTEKFLAFALSAVVVVVAMLIGFWLGVQVTHQDLNSGEILSSVINTLPIMLFVLACTVFIGVAVRHKKMAIAIAVIFILYSYSLDSIGTMAAGSFAENVRILSFFKYYDNMGTMRSGISFLNAGGLVAAAALLMGASLWLWERREIGV